MPESPGSIRRGRGTTRTQPPSGEPGRWRRFWLSLLAALTAHSLWNGSVAVAVALAASRDIGGLRGSDDAYSWGVVLLVLLAVLGVAIPIDDTRSPQAIAAWALVSTTFLIPVTIVILVYPNIVAL